MASKGINWNVVIVGGAVVAGLYLFNKAKTGTTSENYYSGTTGGTIEEVTQPTIRTDLRQSGRTARTALRTERVGLRTDRTISRQENKTERVGIKQSERTERATGRQNVRINKQDEKTARVAIRQTGRTERVAIRTQARQQLRSNIVKSVSNVASKAKTTISNIKTKLKKK